MELDKIITGTIDASKVEVATMDFEGIPSIMEDRQFRKKNMISTIRNFFVRFIDGIKYLIKNWEGNNKWVN